MAAAGTVAARSVRDHAAIAAHRWALGHEEICVLVGPVYKRQLAKQLESVLRVAEYLQITRLAGFFDSVGCGEIRLTAIVGSGQILDLRRQTYGHR